MTTSRALQFLSVLALAALITQQRSCISLQLLSRATIDLSSHGWAELRFGLWRTVGNASFVGCTRCTCAWVR